MDERLELWISSLTACVRSSSAFYWLDTGATVIFCTRGISKSLPPFKMESDPLKTPMSESEFESRTICLVVSVLTTRRARLPAFENYVKAINVYVNSVEWNWRTFLLDGRKYKMHQGNLFLLATVKIARPLIVSLMYNYRCQCCTVK